MKPLIYFIILLSTGLIFIGGSNETKVSDEKINIGSNVTSYKNISANEAKSRLDTEKGIVLLDVRTPEEYAEKHIPNSLLIPLDVLEKDATIKLVDKNAIIFVYCRSGNRSVTASEALVKMGYTNIYNLGGINNWQYETTMGK